MKIVTLYDAQNNREILTDKNNVLPGELLEYEMWSSETNPFDRWKKLLPAGW